MHHRGDLIPLGCHLFPFQNLLLRISKPLNSVVIYSSHGIEKALRHFSNQFWYSRPLLAVCCVLCARSVGSFVCFFFVSFFIFSLWYKCTLLFMCISFHDTCFCVLYKRYASRQSLTVSQTLIISLWTYKPYAHDSEWHTQLFIRMTGKFMKI